MDHLMFAFTTVLTLWVSVFVFCYAIYGMYRVQKDTERHNLDGFPATIPLLIIVILVYTYIVGSVDWIIMGEYLLISEESDVFWSVWELAVHAFFIYFVWYYRRQNTL